MGKFKRSKNKKQAINQEEKTLANIKFYRLIPLKLSFYQRIKLLFGQELKLCVEVDIANQKITDKGII